uniref:DUF4283 domain-containing protein n=1 Tax=Chenopodium quinoa TaxID=63459 RepID=A0A803MH91_CHEQI
MFSVEAMKRTLSSIWRLSDEIAINAVDTNLFVFQCFKKEDKERIMEGRPWFFYGKLLLLKEIQGGEQPSEIEFHTSPMRVRLYDVHFNKRCSSFLYDIGESLGGFVELDESNPLGWGEFVRMKFEIDVRKPLRRGIFVAGGGSKSKWVDIMYERLADFSFFCGILNHIDKECQVREVEGEEAGAVVYQYGTWLRASPMKVPLKSFAVRENERIWGEKLGAIRGEGSFSSNSIKQIKLAPSNKNVLRPKCVNEDNIGDIFPVKEMEMVAGGSKGAVVDGAVGKRGNDNTGGWLNVVEGVEGSQESEGRIIKGVSSSMGRRGGIS